MEYNQDEKIELNYKSSFIIKVKKSEPLKPFLTLQVIFYEEVIYKNYERKKERWKIIR